MKKSKAFTIANGLDEFCDEFENCNDCPLKKRRLMAGIAGQRCPIDMVINSLIEWSEKK